MKLTINTTLLQTMVARAVKGASENKMIPLTSLMAIELKDNTLTIITTDSTNYLYVKSDKVVGDDFYVVIQSEMFSKLVSKLTCENVTMELKENFLNVKGNGSYSIELPLNEDGELIRFPDPVSKVNLEYAGEVKLSTIKLITSTAKASLAETLDNPCYTGYYVGKNVVATDTYKICGINISLFDEPALISASMMDLLDIFTDETIKVSRDGDTVIFESPNTVLYGKFMDSIDDYQIEAINGLLDQEFGSVCKIPKTAMLQLLDRLALFVSAYDKNGIYLTFTRDGLQVESKQANSVELIPYIESSSFHSFTCCADIEMLRSQIKSNRSDSVEIHYGEDNALKMTDGNVTQVVALLEDDRQ